MPPDALGWAARLGSLAGAALALRAWWRNPSFIVDEALLGLNLRERSWLELLRPLDHMQASPPGFLLAERFLMGLFGSDERVLRWIPALALVVAFVALPRLLARAAGPLGVAVGTWLCVACYPIYVTAATAKPYTVEIAAAVVLPLSWLAALEGGRGARWRAVALTSGLIFIGLGVWIVVAGTLAGLLAARDSRRRLVTASWGPPAIALFAAAALAAAAMRAATSPATVEYMQYFWRAAFASGSWVDWAAGWVRILGLELLGLRGRHATVAAAAVLGGWWLAARGRSPVGLAALGVVATSAAVTATGIYPVVVRLSHFLLPSVALGIAALLGPVDRRLARRPGLALVAASAVLLGGAARAVRLDPEIGREQPRQLFAALAARIEPGDRIYVRYGGVPAWRWYVPRSLLPAGAVRLGECWRHDPSRYLDEIEWLRGGARAWVVYSHSSGQLDQELVVHRALAMAGRELERVAADPNGSRRLEDVAWLYDFRDLARFDAALRALDFSATAIQSPSSCGPWATVAAER